MNDFKIIATATLLLLTIQTNTKANENFSISTPSGEESWFVYNNAQPGSTIVDAVVIKNPLNENTKFEIYALDAKILKDNGFAPVEKEIRQRSIGAWLKLDASRVTVPAKTSKKISFSIRIPTNVTPARYMGVILATEAPPKQSEDENSYVSNSNISIQTRVGVRVYINIAGAPAAQDSNKNYTTSIAEKPVRSTTQKISTTTQQKQQPIHVAVTTTSTSTIATQKDTGAKDADALKRYLIQLGQFIINHQQTTAWTILFMLVLLLYIAWRRRE